MTYDIAIDVGIFIGYNVGGYELMILLHDMVVLYAMLLICGHINFGLETLGKVMICCANASV